MKKKKKTTSPITAFGCTTAVGWMNVELLPTVVSDVASPETTAT